MLRPVGAAVEKAGGLPHLDIRLDNSGLDRKPSVEEKPHPVAESAVPDDSDALLELLCDDDDDDDILSPILQGSHDRSRDQSRGQKPAGSLSFDSKLEQLKQELLASSEQQNGNGEEAETSSENGNGEEAQIGSGNGDADSVNRSGNGTEEPVYENTKESDSHRVYQNVTRPDRNDDDDELTNAPSFDTTDQSNHLSAEGFSLKRNECYESTSISASEAPSTRPNVYEDLDDLEKHLEKAGEAEATNGRMYEDMDSVFVEDPNTTPHGHLYDVPDGGMLSRQVPPPQPEQIELDEVVSFKNLPPLVCTAHLGDEVAMKKLADTAASVLTEVVKHIHSDLGMVDFECILTLRVWEIYALENAVFYVAVPWAMQTVNFPCTQHRMFKCTPWPMCYLIITFIS